MFPQAVWVTIFSGKNVHRLFILFICVLWEILCRICIPPLKVYFTIY